MSATLNVGKPSVTPRILEDQTASLQDELARLRAENAALKAAKPAQRVTLKISAEKRCLSLYGIGRFPVTLYASQWQAIVAHADEITAFIEANKADLAWK